MKRHYDNEREGQMDFFDNFRIDYKNNPILIDNTDGIVNGNILEFKLTINNLNKVLFQTIKYLSHMRIKGESVPQNILLISLNTTTVYVYKSEDYFDDIHTVYSGAASKYNDSFIAGAYLASYDYSNMEDTISLRNILKSKEYMPIRIDEDCIVGWAERFYREHPKASKGDFLGTDDGLVPIVGEIRQPYFFKGLIQPYQGKSNEKFKYLMDKLNDNLNKKDLGAFYTPLPYCEKAAELVRKAISRVPEGNDYIILDRCAGTGNLESVLTDEELGHCILSTYEYYEYKVLCERLGDKVRFIIPPTESLVEYSQGFVLNADAMSKEYIENPSIKKYLDDEKCTIILYENPPYSEASTIETNKNNKQFRSGFKNSFVANEFRKYVGGKAGNDIANLFIWSAFKYYLRQSTDSYIVFSPIKYWKYQHVIDKKFVEGFVFNKKHFHAPTPSAVCCILWENQKACNNELKLNVFDITYMDSKASLKKGVVNSINVKKVFNLYSKLYDKRKFEDDLDGIVSEKNGKEAFRKVSIKPKYNKNILGYITAQSFGFEQPRSKANLTTLALYNGHGFYLRNDNYLEKLPLFVGAKYPIEDKWWENGILCTTTDKDDIFVKDGDFLKQCLIFTCLSYYNKCLSFKGSDDRIYQNELCFEDGTIATDDLLKMDLNEDEKELINLYYNILEEARLTNNYKKDLKYGVYQITQELNTYIIDDHKTKIYDYPVLNGNLITLKNKLKEYYKKYIIPKLFEYELIK